jgi:hypothetical protein
MATKPVRAKLKTSPVKSTLSTEELIRERAYRLYEDGVEKTVTQKRIGYNQN